MQENSLEFYNKVKNIISIGTEIKLIEDIDYKQKKIKFSRKKYKIFEIDLWYSWVDIYVSNKWVWVKIDIYPVFIYLIQNKLINEKGLLFFKDILIKRISSDKYCNKISKKNALFLIEYLKIDKYLEKLAW